MVCDGKCVNFMHVLVGLFFLKLAVAFTGEKSVNSNKQGLTMSNALKSIIIEKSKSNQFLGKEKPRKVYFDLLPSNRAHPNRRRLEVCPAGTSYEWGFWDDECEPCNTGKYQNLNNHQVIGCYSCLPGQYQNSRGQSSCNACAPGQYQNLGGQTSCKVCHPGHYQDSGGQSSCKACAVGKYQDDTSQEMCKQCPIGQFSDAVKQKACTNCPAGTSSVAGSSDSSCVNCAIGYYLPAAYAGREDGCLFCAGGTLNMLNVLLNVAIVHFLY